ncbi:Maf family protein [Luteimicrobium sp. NPDC057192]|uniref:Maf family protein n=1 Tax=Luteimicrobium sp. NPDC057192 TaxID=3346042 RepID=UPI0036281887
MSRVRLLLASASPARLATLRAAGVEPEVLVSGVDEPAVLDAARADGPLSPADAVLVLAQAKARDVVGRVRDGSPDDVPDLVLGCDSMLELDGEVLGKPASPDEARERWHGMRGRTGVLHTGHWLVDLRDDGDRARDLAAPGPVPADRPHELGETSSTSVTFADVTDAEIDAYVATGEPLHVAGAFTIDGLGGAFVERVEGDHHGVVGLSLPTLRRLLLARDVAWTDLWSTP